MAMDKEGIVRAVDGNLIVELAQRMVAIPTQNPPGKEKPCAQLIHDTLVSWGLEAEMVAEPDPERPQVVAWLRGARGDGPTLVLNGHMDTVAEGDLALWRRSPFDPAIEGGRLHGLGAADMKGSLAAAMVVVKTLKDAGRPFSGTLMFQAAMGEEMDEPGTKTLLKKGYTGDRAIVLEPTDLRVGPATRGACWHRITLEGPFAHCGLTPADRPDVMQAFADFGTRLTAYHRDVSRQTHHLLESPGCRVTQMEAPSPHNSTARRCTFIVDRRMLPGETPERITGELREILDQVCESHPQIAHEISFVAWNEPTETALDDPLVTALQAGHREVIGREADIWGPPYGSDLRNFVWDAGIPAVNFGAGDFNVCHQPNEFVPTADLIACGRIVTAAVLELLDPR